MNMCSRVYIRKVMGFSHWMHTVKTLVERRPQSEAFSQILPCVIYDEISSTFHEL